MSVELLAACANSGPMGGREAPIRDSASRLWSGQDCQVIGTSPQTYQTYTHTAQKTQRKHMSQ